MNPIVFGCCGPTTLAGLHDNVFKTTECELTAAHESAGVSRGAEDGDAAVEMPLGQANQSGPLKAAAAAAAVHSAG